MDNIGVVLLAAGQGKRMGDAGNKLFMHLAGQTLLSRALATFFRFEAVVMVAVVAAPGEEDLCRREVEGLSNRGKPYMVVRGGARRQDSVRQGLKSLPQEINLVAVHDGARPLFSLDLLVHVLAEASRYGAALAALPVIDTIKVAGESEFVLSTPPRERLWAAQTPQAFRREILEEAYLKAEQAGLEATDDASLVEALGCVVKLVPGEQSNLKITTPLDLLLAEAILASPMGMGG